MCDIDFYNAMEENIEINAKQAARYTAAYNQELQRLQSKNKPASRSSNENQPVSRPNSEENEIRKILTNQTKRLITLEKFMVDVMNNFTERSELLSIIEKQNQKIRDLENSITDVKKKLSELEHK